MSMLNYTGIVENAALCIGLDNAINVKRTAKLQWKVDTIKNCEYLQCRSEQFW